MSYQSVMHVFRLLLLLATPLLLLPGCATSNTGKYYEKDGPPSALSSWRASGAKPVTLKVEQPSKWANRPYTVMGKRYVPMTGDKPLTQVGTASWYGKQFHGKKTSLGEVYDMYQLTAAHPTMELPSFARVTNLKNGRSIIVRVNDRGPFLHGRIIDLSYAAAVQLGYQKEGTARVRVERITRKDIAAGKVSPSASATANLVSTVTSSLAQNRTSSPSSKTVAAAAAATVIRHAANNRQTVPAVKSTSSEKNDHIAEVITVTQPQREPTAIIEMQVEETDPITLPQQSPEGSFRPIAAQKNDGIGAVLEQEEATQRQADAALPAIETSTAAASGSWSVQLGAYSIEDNARSAAAHAEMMLAQENLSPVTVVKTKTVYKVYACQLASRAEAVQVAQRVSKKLGLKAIPIKR